MTGTVVVVGAGASGLLAAGSAAQEGARVILLEKMDRIGRKLRITGKGRCNITNAAELPEFLTHFGPGGRFLRPALFAFPPSDLIGLMDRLGVPTVVERGDRVFPASEQAQDVVDALERWVRGLGVECRTASRVESILVESGRAAGVLIGPGGTGRAGRAPDARGPGEAAQPSSGSSPARRRGGAGGALDPNTVVRADAVILAAGGASYPGTGSTGDSYRLAEAAGHTLVPIRPSLVPLVTAGTTAGRLEGLSLRSVTARLLVDGKRKAEAFGEMVFTDKGVSGPIILTLSREAVDALAQDSRVELSLDLKPALDEQKLDARILRDLLEMSRRQAHTVLQGLLPRRLIEICLEQTGIPRDRVCSQITAAERTRLRLWLKSFALQVTAAGSMAEAIVTAGGVDRREVDSKTLRSRLVPGLYLAGEVLDIDADTGGFNLQAAFSTGWLAGKSAARDLAGPATIP